MAVGTVANLTGIAVLGKSDGDIFRFIAVKVSPSAVSGLLYRGDAGAVCLSSLFCIQFWAWVLGDQVEHDGQPLVVYGTISQLFAGGGGGCHGVESRNCRWGDLYFLPGGWLLGGARLCGEAPSVPGIGSAVLPVSVASAVVGCGGFGVSGTSVAGVDGWAVVVLSPFAAGEKYREKQRLRR